ncbi:hypothetical protein ACHAQK_009279 [Fusarium lateritium]
MGLLEGEGDQLTYNGKFISEIASNSQQRVHWWPQDRLKMQQWLIEHRHSETSLKTAGSSLTTLARDVGLDLDRLDRKQRMVMRKKMLSSLDYTLKFFKQKGLIAESWDPRAKRRVVNWPEELVRDIGEGQHVGVEDVTNRGNSRATNISTRQYPVSARQVVGVSDEDVLMDDSDGDFVMAPGNEAVRTQMQQHSQQEIHNQVQIQGSFDQALLDEAVRRSLDAHERTRRERQQQQEQQHYTPHQFSIPDPPSLSPAWGQDQPHPPHPPQEPEPEPDEMALDPAPDPVMEGLQRQVQSLQANQDMLRHAAQALELREQVLKAKEDAARDLQETLRSQEVVTQETMRAREIAAEESLRVRRAEVEERLLAHEAEREQRVDGLEKMIHQMALQQQQTTKAVIRNEAEVSCPNTPPTPIAQAHNRLAQLMTPSRTYSPCVSHSDDVVAPANSFHVPDDNTESELGSHGDEVCTRRPQPQQGLASSVFANTIPPRAIHETNHNTSRQSYLPSPKTKDIHHHRPSLSPPRPQLVVQRHRPLPLFPCVADRRRLDMAVEAIEERRITSHKLVNIVSRHLQARDLSCDERREMVGALVRERQSVPAVLRSGRVLGYFLSRLLPEAG